MLQGPLGPAEMVQALSEAAETHGAEFVADRADASARVRLQQRPEDAATNRSACQSNRSALCAGLCAASCGAVKHCTISSVQDYTRRLREEQDEEFQRSLEADRQREAAEAAEAERQATAAQAAARAEAEARWGHPQMRRTADSEPLGSSISYSSVHVQLRGT